MDDQGKKYDIFRLPLYTPADDEVTAAACKLVVIPASDPRLTSLSHANEVLHQCLTRQITPVTEETLKRVSVLLSQRTEDLCFQDTLRLGTLCLESAKFPNAKINFKAAWQLRSRKSFLVWDKLEQTKNEFAKALELQSKLAEAKAEQESRLHMQAKATAEVAQTYEEAVRKWNALGADMQSVLEKTRRVQEALGIIPSRQKERLEDAKERYARGKTSQTLITRKMAAAQKALQKLKLAYETTTKKKAVADADVQRCKRRSMQVQQLVEHALQMQANETERVRLIYAKQSMKRMKKGSKESVREGRKGKDTRHGTGADSEDEGLVYVTVNRNLEKTVKSLQRDLKNSAGVVEQLNAIAEDAKKQLVLEKKQFAVQLETTKEERNKQQNIVLSLREKLINMQEEAREQRSSLEQVQASASDQDMKHREEESGYTAALSELNIQISRERQAKDKAYEQLESEKRYLVDAQSQLSAQKEESNALVQRCNELNQVNSEQETCINDLHQNMARTAQQLVRHAQDLQNVRSELADARASLTIAQQQHVAEQDVLKKDLDKMQQSWSQLAGSKGETDEIYSQAMHDQKVKYDTNLQDLSRSLGTVRAEYEASLAGYEASLNELTNQHDSKVAKLEDQLLKSVEAYKKLGKELDAFKNEKLHFLGSVIELDDLHKAQCQLNEIGYSIEDDQTFYEKELANVKARLKQSETYGQTLDEPQGHGVKYDIEHSNSFDNFDRINTEIADLLQSEQCRKQLYPIQEEVDLSESEDSHSASFSTGLRRTSDAGQESEPALESESAVDQTSRGLEQ